ncbi:hypothetical protein ABC383_17775 [Noviherbaspirillum sp. 1P10PC]|uniref:LEM-3-like GIY-YIG domain-containing protein n=1 Tax=Noviherbaspirillum sp. 1P10PC TaxID=3132292 RepID=UPI0039A38A87
MEELTIRARNPKREFAPGEYAQIGRKYVYALQDPTDQRIFYVGQGTGNRVFEHLKRAEILLQSRKRLSPKFEAIHAVWKRDQDVSLVILAGGLSDGEADIVESATLDALNLSANGELTNAISAPHSSMVRVEDLAASAYPYVNPDRPYRKVLVFPVPKKRHNPDIYERCRRKWKVAKKHRALGTDATAPYAVAIDRGVSVGAYRVTSWKRLEDKKWEFEGEPYEALRKLNWRAIIQPAMGYWQRGNYLVVEFDGAGHFRIVRGSKARSWKACDEQAAQAEMAKQMCLQAEIA